MSTKRELCIWAPRSSSVQSSALPGQRSRRPPSCWASVALGGIAYVGVVVRRIHQLGIYKPVMEDWVWRGILPLVAYAALVVAAPLLPGSATLALFGVVAALVLLLFIGIHNAWDEVTYIAVELPQRPDGQIDGQQAGRTDE
jgi:hypothetical protein